MELQKSKQTYEELQLGTLPVVLQHCVEVLPHYPHKPVLFAGLVLTLLWTAEY
jgi:hypothetical protein